MTQTDIYARYAIALIACVTYLGIGLRSIGAPRDLKSLWEIGLGAINSRTIIRSYLPSTGSKALVANVLLANFPQLAFSLIYFTYNSLFTYMLLAHEWSTYAIKRKGLRVSSAPKGQQRSTYFLQLPYAYSIPLLILSFLMHWLCSQSLFVVNVQMLDPYGAKMAAQTFENSGGDRSVNHLLTCGFSPMAIIFGIIVGALMVGFVLVTSLRRLASGMPVASSCSAAISAACHAIRDDSDKNIELRKLKWGLVINASSAKSSRFEIATNLSPDAEPLVSASMNPTKPGTLSDNPMKTSEGSEYALSSSDPMDYLTNRDCGLTDQETSPPPEGQMFAMEVDDLWTLQDRPSSQIASKTQYGPVQTYEGT